MNKPLPPAESIELAARMAKLGDRLFDAGAQARRLETMAAGGESAADMAPHVRALSEVVHALAELLTELPAALVGHQAAVRTARRGGASN